MFIRARYLLLLAALGAAAPCETLAGAGGSANCLRALDIDHTSVPDNRTILFHMKDGRIWSTTLTSYCPELSFNGFEYGPTPPDEVCGNLQTIRVLRSGAVCEMGPLVPATPPAQGSHS